MHLNSSKKSILTVFIIVFYQKIMGIKRKKGNPSATLKEKRLLKQLETAYNQELLSSSQEISNVVVK